LLGARGMAQLLSKTFRELFPPEDGQQALELVRQQREGGPVTPFVEQELVRIDGKRVTVELSATPMVFQDKPAMQIIAHDLRPRLQAEQTLRKSEARKSAILESALDAII